jgi:hypothetical protein
MPVMAKLSARVEHRPVDAWTLAGPLDGPRHADHHELFQLNLSARVVDVDPDNSALFAEIEDDAIGDFLALSTRLIR